MQERDTCLCEKCENMHLLVSALNRAKAIDETSGLALIRSVCCLERNEECMKRTCKVCQSKEIKFKTCDDNLVVKRQKWVTIQEERKIRKKKSQSDGNNNGPPGQDKSTGKKKTKGQMSGSQDTYEVKIVKRTLRKTFDVTVGDLKKELQAGFGKYMEHVFRDFHQLLVLREKRKHLGPSDIYVWMDFSQNYQCKYGREIQSHYFGGSHEEVKMHTGVVYLEEDKKYPSCSLSKNLRCDPPAILAHLYPVLDKYLKPGMSRLHLQSDSPVTQYRNKTMFRLITTEIPKRYPQITEIIFNYTEAGHGKGAPDGVGGKAKTIADQVVSSDGDVDTLEALATVLQEKCKNILILVIEEEQITEIDELVPAEIQTFTGTMKVHQITWTKEHPHTIYFNSVSCYDCAAGTKCSHYNLAGSPMVRQEVAANNDDSPDDPDPISPPVSVKKGDWVAVQYGSHWYPGKHK